MDLILEKVASIVIELLTKLIVTGHFETIVLVVAGEVSFAEVFPIRRSNKGEKL